MQEPSDQCQAGLLTEQTRGRRPHSPRCQRRTRHPSGLCWQHLGLLDQLGLSWYRWPDPADPGRYWPPHH